MCNCKNKSHKLTKDDFNEQDKQRLRDFLKTNGLDASKFVILTGTGNVVATDSKTRLDYYVKHYPDALVFNTGDLYGINN